MALRKIVVQGEDCLNKVCRPVTDFNFRLHLLMDDLVETLSEAGGAGLAAPQIGILRRVAIVGENPANFTVFYFEGCGKKLIRDPNPFTLNPHTLLL